MGITSTVLACARASRPFAHFCSRPSAPSAAACSCLRARLFLRSYTICTKTRMRCDGAPSPTTACAASCCCTCVRVKRLGLGLGRGLGLGLRLRLGLGLDLHDDVAQRRGVICAQLRSDGAQQQAQECELDLAPPG